MKIYLNIFLSERMYEMHFVLSRSVDFNETYFLQLQKLFWKVQKNTLQFQVSYITNLEQEEVDSHTSL